MLVVDSVLHFTAFWPDGGVDVLERFIEVDRCTESLTRVMAKLRTYVELYRYRPREVRGGGWRAEFERFPNVIVVLCGASERVLINRRDLLLQMCQQDTVMAKACGLDSSSGQKAVDVSFTVTIHLPAFPGVVSAG